MAVKLKKQDATTQPHVAMKDCGSVVTPLSMTYIGSTRKVMIPSQVQMKIERIAFELKCLPEEVAVAWLEQMLELHE
jgi:hypothetical protein